MKTEETAGVQAIMNGMFKSLLGSFGNSTTKVCDGRLIRKADGSKAIVTERKIQDGISINYWIKKLGGEGGIRTLGKVTPTHAFQACSFNHSDTSPIRTAGGRIVCRSAENRKDLSKQDP
jgi:hypothetical protein